MSDAFETWLKRVRVPFNGQRFRALAGAIGHLLGDRPFDWAQAAAKEHLPGWAGTEGRALLASERQIPVGTAETVANVRARLKAWRQQHRLRGTPLGLLVQLYFNGWSNAALVQQNGRAHYIGSTPNLADLTDTMAAAPSWYTIVTLANGNPAIPASTDGKAAIPALTIPWFTFDAGMDSEGNQFCGRFGVIIPVPGEPAGYSLTVAENLTKIRKIIREWKPTKAKCQGIWVATAGAMWGWPPTQAWGDPGLLWGGVVTFYSAA